jgi:hypothetical protein
MEIQDRLIVGIDISDMSQICYYDKTQSQPESVCGEDNSFLFSHDFALTEASLEQLTQHFGELFLELKRRCGYEKPDKLVITTDVFEKAMLDKMSEALKALGISEKRYSFISHEESFAYYAFHQKKELYINGVMLLDYKKDGLYSHYMTVMKKNGMNIVPQESHAFTSEEILAASAGQKSLEQIKDSLCECISTAVKDKTISSVYLTGKGFENGEFPKEFTHLLCTRRKAFTGQNLFVKGACHLALEQAESEVKPPHEGLLLACSNRITTGIEMDITQRGEKKRFRLVKAGVNWYHAGRSMEFILEDIRKITFITKPCDTGAEYQQEMDISQIPYREGKMTRIRLDLAFDCDSVCNVTVTDLGFGEFIKSSGVVVKSNLQL